MLSQYIITPFKPHSQYIAIGVPTLLWGILRFSVISSTRALDYRDLESLAHRLGLFNHPARLPCCGAPSALTALAYWGTIPPFYLRALLF